MSELVGNYTPSLGDPRVMRRVAEAVSWAEYHLSPDREFRVHRDRLQQVFGNRAGPLSKWLRANLLIQVGAYQTGVKSYGYLLNERGLQRVRAVQNGARSAYAVSSKKMLTTGAACESEQMLTAYALRAHGVPSFPADYVLKSDRYIHPAQQIRRAKKQEYWGELLPFDYDISACGPTVLFQLALGYGFLPVLSEGVRDYLEHKDEFRALVSELSGLNFDDSKGLLTSLFNGAPLSFSPFHSTFKMVNQDREVMTRLKHHPRMKTLTNSIKCMWAVLKRRVEFKSRWSLYFALERKIVEAVAAHAAAYAVSIFMEHDGWRTSHPLPVAGVQEAILKATGFKLTIKEKT